MDISKSKTVIGVTGQIGAGKTTAAGILSNILQARLIEVDKLAQELYSLDVTKKFFKDNFRSEIIRNNEVNRRLLGKIVFGDRKRLQILNRFFDRMIFEKLVEAIKNCRDRYIIIDAAILLQTSWVKLTEIIVVVHAPEVLKLNRASKKLKIHVDAVEMRMDHQLSEEELLKYADYIVENDGTVEELNDRIKEIVSRIRGTVG